MCKKNHISKLLIFIIALPIVIFFAISNSNSFNKDFNAEINQTNKPHKFRLVGVVCSYLNRLYVEPDRIKPKEMLRESLIWLERLIPEVRVDINDETEEIKISVDDLSKTIDFSRIRRLSELYMAINEALHFVNDNKSDKIKAEDIEYAAINGMLTQLDPHSVVFPPKNYTEFKIGTSGKFGGLGMVVGLRDGILTVISPIEGTPAYRADLKSGDKIIAIDEDSTINMSLPEAVSKLRGEPSTTVILTIESGKTKTTKAITLTREIIAIPSVDSTLLGDNIGYIKIRNFQEDTTDALEEHISQLITEGGTLKGLVLDLRKNSGGLLDQAIAVSDKFLSSGVIVVTVGPMGKHEELQKAKKSSQDLAKCPLVVIIDAGSASGAEIVAGALKDNNRAILIGDLSFGKGSIQQLIDLMEGAALKLTIGKYLTPNFTDIQSVGITPDILLVQTHVKEDEIIIFNEDFHTREKDLKKHLDESSITELPFGKVKYLSIVDKKTKEEQDEDYYKLPDLTEDTHVQFAKKIINATIDGKKEKILKQLEPTIEDFKKIEEEKISSALGTLEIDWSTGKPSVSPTATTSLNITPDNGNVKAGGEIAIKVSVTNNSEGALFQLRGISESKNPLFDKHEFILGKIEKGGTKTYAKTIKIHENALSREDEFTIKFTELNGNELKDIKSKITIEALPRPIFAYSYQIIDSGEGLKGNGDGIIQKGEVINLVLLIKNIGQGASKKNIFALRNLSNKEVFIEKGKMELGELLPSESKSVKMKLSVRDILNTDNFSIDITIADTTFGTRISDKMTFYVDPNNTADTIKTTKKSLRVIDNNVPIYNGKSISTPVIAYANKGTLLVADKEAQTWFRVNMPEDRFGWIPSGNVEINSSGELDPQNFLDLCLQNVPPLIDLDMQKPSDTFGLEHFSLSGTVRDDIKVKYVYVLANDDKVFYKSNKGILEAEETGLSFSCDIPLEEGPNTISVIARDEQDLLSSKSFVITRNALLEKSVSHKQTQSYSLP
ncbi:MAG: MXAN_5808 family serine peptidase [Candidatus Scalindua sp.]